METEFDKLLEGAKVKKISGKLGKITFEDEAIAHFYKLIMSPLLNLYFEDVDSVYVSGKSLYLKFK